jgi:fibronectin-binding autotransporter adhesin
VSSSYVHVSGKSYAPYAQVFRAFALGTLAVWLLSHSTYADKTWTNTGTTDFNTAGNWTPSGVPGSSDAAIFNVAKVTNPNLSASVTVDHLDFSAAGASGYDLTSSSTSIKLTLLNTTTGLNAAIHSAITSGSDTIDAPIVLGAASGQTQVFNQSSGGTLIVNGVVSSTNTVGLSLRGGGTVQLNGANTYTGNTSIDTNNETLILGNDNALGTGTLTNNALGAAIQAGGGARSISNAISLSANTTISGSNNLTLSGIVSGSFTLTKSGSGTLTLSGGNTYTNATTISAGVVNIQSATGLGTTAGGTTVSSGAALQLQGGIAVGAEALTLNGSGIASDGALRNISGNNSYAGAVTLSSASTINSDAGTLTLSGDVATGGFALTFGGTSSIIESGIISGTGGLIKNNAGTVTLSGVNTYSGATTLNGGVLLLNNANALPGGIGAAGGATALTINGGAVGLGAGDFSRGLGTGTAQVQFTGSGGFAAYGTDRNVNLGGASAQVTWGSGSFVPTGSILILGASGADKTVTFQNPIALGASTRTVQTDNGSAAVDAVLSGVLSGTGGLTKTGTGILSLSAANTYTGATTVGSSGGADAGTLRLSGSGTISNATTTVYGGTLDLNGTNQSITVLALGGGASGSTSVVTIGAGNLSLGNNITYSATNNPNGATISGVGGGKLNLLGNRIFTINDSTATAADLTISAIIADGDATARSLTKAGAGTLVLTGINTYTGLTQVGASGADNSTAGTLQLSGSGKISNATATVVAGTLDLNGTTQTITNLNVSAGGSLAGSTATVNIGSGGVLNLGGNIVYAGGALLAAGAGTISAGTLNLNGTRTFTVNDSTAVATDMAVSSVIANGSTGSGLTKAGAGTLALSGANTFTGATTINAGTLTAAAASGSALGSTSGITVNSGGTLLLGGNDQINDSATMSLGGGTFAKGDFNEGTASAVGVGALTLTASSHIDFGTGTVGVLTFASLNASTFTLTIDNWTGNSNTVGSGSTDRLIFNSDQASNLSSFFFTGYGAGGVEFNLGGGYWEVVAAVPEPSTWIVAALSLAALGYYHVRRRWGVCNQRH